MRRFLVVATLIVFVGLNISNVVFAGEEKNKEVLKQELEETKEQNKQAAQDAKEQKKEVEEQQLQSKKMKVKEVKAAD